MGDKSTPRIFALGYKSPTKNFNVSILSLVPYCRSDLQKKCKNQLSIAQIPVPVPMSNTFPGFSPSGAKCSRPPSRFTTIACFMSSLSCSLGSLGKLYDPSLNLWYLLPFSNAKSLTLLDIDVDAEYIESVSYPASDIDAVSEVVSDPLSISISACACSTAARVSESWACAIACSSGESSACGNAACGMADSTGAGLDGFACEVSTGDFGDGAVVFADVGMTDPLVSVGIIVAVVRRRINECPKVTQLSANFWYGDEEDEVQEHRWDSIYRRFRREGLNGV